MAQQIAKQEVLKFKIHPEITHQTIHNFGASDAWSAQFVGKYWPEESKKTMAKWLFSKKNKEDGSPEGIGLTAWRFNIGAGSAEQGAEIGKIIDEWRQAECFLNPDGSFNFNKQEGQQWFLKEAKSYGVETFVGFVNSPPVYFTENNKAWSGNGIKSNLLNTHYKNYAEFLAKVVKGVQKNTGVTFSYISPFNEPQWEWECCKQEGTPWTNSEMYEAVKSIDFSFQEHQISSKIELTEAAKINYLYTTDGKPNRGNQMDYFFNPESEGYVGHLTSVAKKVAGHSYFTTWGPQTLINTRKALNESISKTNLEYWMTEYCILEDNEEIKGGGRDLGIDAALYVAKVIHSDLVIANASAWHWWLAISPYDYKDGLIYIDYNKHDGRYYASKMLWALGHYSRFIKPGMKRIESVKIDNKSNQEMISGVLQSAYASKEEIVVVFVNQLQTDAKISLSGIPKGFSLEAGYQTTSESGINLKRIPMGHEVFSEVILPKRSLMTCVFKKGKF